VPLHVKEMPMRTSLASLTFLSSTSSVRNDGGVRVTGVVYTKLCGRDVSLTR
jgi:hypothetical protein